MTTDLFDMISRGDFKPGGAANPRKQKAKRHEQVADKLKEEREKVHSTALNLQFWKQTALIQVVFETTCSCGQRSNLPEIRTKGERPLVRHERSFPGEPNPRIWEFRLEGAEPLRANLPIIYRKVDAFTCICPSCHPEIF